MRLQRLDLTRYGKFSGHSIDFGDRQPGKPDLHIIYGPNEAGKSTALAAFLDLLFGIEPRSRFNFLHQYPAMRIGAALEIGGQIHELIRIKRDRNDLLDRNESPISTALITGQLGNIDRGAYRSMFSLDDETLEAGGENILASKGDLGELLFSATTGLADLSHELVKIRTDTDNFYKPHARNTELATLKTRLATLKTERDQIDTAASVYAALTETRDRAHANYNEALDSRTKIQSRMDEIQRYVGALPRLDALRSARAKLLPLADLPAAPAEWRTELPNIQKQDITLAVQAETIDLDVKQKEQDLASIVIDQAALDNAHKLQRLDQLRARYLTAEKDIPARQHEAQEQSSAIDLLLARIGRTGESDPAHLLFNAATIGALQDLIKKQSGVEAATGAATRELSEANHRLEDSLTKLQDAGGSPASAAPLTALAAVVAALQSDDHPTRRRIAERTRAASIDELADRLRALRPWEGDADQLADLSVPEPAQIHNWKTAQAEARKIHDRCESDVEKLTADQRRLTAERDAITTSAGIVNDSDAAEIRSAREAAWTGHRRTLDAESADRFESTLRQDDKVTQARFDHQQDIARLHQTTQNLALVEADARHAQQRLDTASAKLLAITTEITAAITTVLPNDTTLIQFESWLAKRDKALETRTKLRQADRDLRDAETDATQAKRKLTIALQAAGIEHDTDATTDVLRGTAQQAIDRETKIEALRTAVDDRRRDLETRERSLAAAQAKDQAWHEAWRQACATSWLQDAGATPATVSEIIPAVTTLGHALKTRTSLVSRIDAMQADQRDFVAEITAIADDLDLPADIPPLDLAHIIAARINDASAAVTKRGTAEQALKDARDRQRTLADTRKIHDKRKAEMTGHFGVATLTQVAEKLSALTNKSNLQQQASAAERDILDAVRLPTIDAAEAALHNADRTALETELAGLKTRFDDQDQRTRELFAQRIKAEDQLEAVGGDAAVAKIEEQRRTTLLEIEDGAMRYLRLRLGVVAAEHALRAYRQQHRSSMMTRASEAFRTISRDAYAGLATQPSKDSEILIARAADGSSKIASELSKGTRFQLYLALRVAGYQEFARLRPPVPFVADDIMETFDDFRAEEALRLLASMGEVGQTIYLTHHRHLCDIAQRICPGIQIHELTPNPA